MPAIKLSQFLHLIDESTIASGRPLEMWVHPDDISSFEISCHRTPIVSVSLRSRDKTIEVRGQAAKDLMLDLRAPRK